jgi:AraC-like DNA-binding protein
MAMPQHTDIENAQLARVAPLLSMTAWSIAQVAECAGFRNAYYFSSRFRRRHGVPPSQFRARHKLGYCTISQRKS